MSDPFEFDDAAYVLGALAPAERATFEGHLVGCAACRARVDEVSGVPGLLVGLDETDLVADDPVPDVLPLLLARARRDRRRQRGLVATLVAVAAACLAALLVVVLVHRAAPTGDPTAAAKPFTVLVPDAVEASAVLQPEPWGTAIDIRCRYASAGTTRAFVYLMVAYDRSGHSEALGSWELPPGRNISFSAGSAWPPHAISRIDITTADGHPLLRLRP